MGKQKKWEMRFSRDDQMPEIQAIAQALRLTPLTAALLYHRGCHTPEAARRFVQIEEEYLYDPFLLTDMNRAASRVKQAIEREELIVIYGDYDADGVTATTVLYSYLRSRGAMVDYFIPDRFRDGYGMNVRAIRELKDKGCSLIVTVDNGITAVEPAALAAELGMELVITDHHEPHGPLPQAYAIVNPHREDDRYPFKELAGVGVAFKLICAIELLRDPEGDSLRELCTEQLDLVAVGTVADVMPLTRENRLIVRMGLHQLQKTVHPGLSALMEQASANKRVSASTVSFTLAPRINAAGRLGSAMRAVELLLAESCVEASAIAAELCDFNRERQNEESGIFSAAQSRMEALDAEQDAIFVLDHDDWHPGVIGIAASRITERYGRPTFLITYDGDVGKGSARSVTGVNLMSLLAECADLLIQYGGHEMAAGLTIMRDRVPEFRRRICAAAKRAFPDGMPIQVTTADCEITLQDVTLAQIEQLSVLEPCGAGNSQPMFLLCSVEICEMVPLSGGKHTRLQIRRDGAVYTAMYFGVPTDRLDYLPGDTVDMLVQMDLNEWNGRTMPQLLVRDMDRCLAVREELERAEDAVSRFLSGEEDAIPPETLPVRADFARVYRYLRHAAEGDVCHTTVHMLNGALYGGSESGWRQCQLILRVFASTGLLTIETEEAGIADTGTSRGARLCIRIAEQTERVDLEDDALYRQMMRVGSAAGVLKPIG